jgi:hypothetical protein
MRQLAVAQRRRKIARQDDALPAPLGQTLVGQEVGAFL